MLSMGLPRYLRSQILYALGDFVVSKFDQHERQKEQ
jgi:hypothetical protein